jgi:hypothetical protein
MTKTIYMFNTILSKIPITFCTLIEKLIFKYLRKHKRHPISIAILSKKFNAGGIITPNFKLYYRAIQ